ncbi:MAG: hypothetical protein AAFX41_09535, partial [Bacteroidota bacterium]
AGIFRDAGLIDRADATQLSTSRAKRAARASLDIATRLYQSGDAAWKVYAFEMERSRYARALPEASPETLDRIAARIVRDTYPTYSKVPEAIQKLRRLPVLGPFVSFPAEVLRTTYHTLRLVRNDLADPRRRQIGLRRAAGVLAQGAITGAATTGALALSGLTEDDERDVRRLAPRWDRSGLLTVWKEPVKDENGRPTGRTRLRYTNLSYSDPHAMLREPVLAVVRGMEARRASVTREGMVGEPMSDADLLRLALDAATPLLDPFLSEDILAGRMIDVLRNRDEYGRAVYDADRPETWVEAVTAHLYEGVEPGLLQQVRRIREASRDTSGRLGPERVLADEMRAYLTGARVQTLDPARGLGYRAFDLERSLRAASATLSVLLTQAEDPSEEAMRQVLSDALDTRRNAFREAEEAYQAALNLGLTPERTFGTFKASSGKATAEAVRDRTPRPLVVDRRAEQAPRRALAQGRARHARTIIERRRRLKALLDAIQTARGGND